MSRSSDRQVRKASISGLAVLALVSSLPCMALASVTLEINLPLPIMPPLLSLVQLTLELPIRVISVERWNYARNLSEELAVPLLLLISLPLPVALGFLSATRIDKSRGRLKGVSLSMAAIGIAMMSLLLSGPFLARRLMQAADICREISIMTNEEQCRQNITLLGAALFRYAEAHNGRYPDPKYWCDEIIKTGCVQGNTSLDWLAVRSVGRMR